jgi:hypothetical protein
MKIKSGDLAPLMNRAGHGSLALRLMRTKHIEASGFAGFLFYIFLGLEPAQALGPPGSSCIPVGGGQGVVIIYNGTAICSALGSGGSGGPFSSIRFTSMFGPMSMPDPFFSDVPGSTMDMGGPDGWGGSSTSTGDATGSFSRPDPQIGYISTVGDNYRVTDTTGAASGVAPSFHTNAEGFTENGHINLSPWLGLGSNQRLSLGGAVSYSPSQTSFAGGGSIDSQMYTFTGGLAYGQTVDGSGKRGYTGLNGYYTILSVSVGAGRGTRNDNMTGGTGSYGERSYTGDLRYGRVYTLANSPATSLQGASALKLDVSAHVGRYEDSNSSFTDSSGFMFGDEILTTWQAGARARLEQSVLTTHYVLTPFIAGTVDQYFGFHHTFDQISTSDTLTYYQDKTFGGAQIGVDIHNIVSGVYGGGTVFYESSGDTHSLGVRGYFTVPFDVARFVNRQAAKQ